MNANERRILVVTSLGHWMSHYNMAVFPALVLPLAATLNLDMPRVLELSFWHYLLFGVTALPWGMAGDRWSANALMAVMFMGSSLAGLAAGIWVDSPAGLCWALAGLGWFSGIYHPIGFGMISKGVARVHMAMGYNAVSGGFGLVVGPLATGLVNWASGPAAAFFAVAILNLVGLAVMAVAVPAAEEKETVRQSASPDGYLVAFLILLIPMMIGGMAFTGATVILPAYLELKSKAVLAAVSQLWPGGPVR